MIRRLLVAFLLLVFVVSMVSGYALDAALEARDIPRQEADWPTGLAFLAFAVVGAVLALRVRGNLLGWLMLGIAVVAATSLPTANYATYSARVEGMPATSAVAWFAGWAWFPPSIALFTLLPLLFPTGRLPSARWRWAAGAAIAAISMLVVSYAFEPGYLDINGARIRNPMGIDSLEPLLGLVAAAGFALALVAMLGAIASVIVRYHRASGEERAQMKWFAYAVMLNAFLMVVTEVVPPAEDLLGDVIFGVAISLLPASIAVGVLKYRLYDIDVVINRTLVYVALSAVLLSAYGASVLLFRAVLDPLTGDNDLAIAASTLAVAALFGPARRRIQRFIDRRFYRTRYDAQRTLEAFAARLRDEVDLRELSSDVVAVVDHTVRPAHVSLWVPPGETR